MSVNIEVIIFMRWKITLFYFWCQQTFSNKHQKTLENHKHCKARAWSSKYQTQDLHNPAYDNVNPAMVNGYDVRSSQWCNRQGGRVTNDREIFADVSGKKGEGKKGKGVKIEKKRRKMVKGRFKIGNGSRKSCGKSILQVPDTGTSQYWWIPEHFWCTSIAWKCDIYVLLNVFVSFRSLQYWNAEMV